MRRFHLSLVALLFCSLAAAQTTQNQTGILLMAHGGSKEWNDQVINIVSQVNATIPAEAAFGMANRTTLQAGVDKLTARGVKQIVAVPLFVSSHSSVFDSLSYLLGARSEAPADLEMFASMDHDMKNMKESDSRAPKSTDKTKPVTCSVPLRMTNALDHHPIVAGILLDRAKAISKDPKHEVVILVAHGPQSDQENALWLEDMAALAKQVESGKKFARVEYLTLRDDADDPIRNQATEQLRHHVDAAGQKKQRALIVPLLLSYGGIDGGLRKRLDGLDHTMSPQAILPDPRIVQWVLDSAREAELKVAQKGGS
jgi:sirohydrochlorin cobaltochelatase